MKFTATINGKKVVYYIGPLKGVSDNGRAGKANSYIRTDKMTPFQVLDTIIHETLHHSNWSKSEKVVNRTATDIAHILRKCGYLKHNPQD